MNKDYEFRRLNATDLFAMMKLIKKIGISSFTDLISPEAVKALTTGKKGETTDDEALAVGTMMFGAVELIIDRLADCEDEVFNLLSRTSNLSLKEVKALDMDVFVKMIFDFVKKEESMSFFNAVIASLKSAK